MNVKQFRDFVVVPSLEYIGAYSLAAEQLVIGTALAESNLDYIQQTGGGPARGLFQMEPRTHDDIWENWLRHKPHIVDGLKGLLIRDMDLLDQLRGNLFYAAAMCRIHYLRFSEPLPPENDWPDMARYWKKYYNTHLGAGTPQHFLQKSRPFFDLYAGGFSCSNPIRTTR